jgi:ubiquitin-protein ligase
MTLVKSCFLKIENIRTRISPGLLFDHRNLNFHPNQPKMASVGKMTTGTRLKFITKKWAEAVLDGPGYSYHIARVSEDNLEHFYILLETTSGVYRDQLQVIEVKTTWPDGTIYPDFAPRMVFVTPVYHTNVSTTGTICVDILKEKNAWSSCYGFNDIMLSIMMLYRDANNSSPYNVECSEEHVKALKAFDLARKPNMSVEEEEKVRDGCFANFKKKADKYAWSKRKVQEKYGKWFPHILENPSAEDTARVQADVAHAKMIQAKEKKAHEKNLAAINSRKEDSRGKRADKFARRRAKKASPTKASPAKASP